MQYIENNTKAGLTKRENVIYNLVICKNMTNKEAANFLSITERTVKSHMSSILSKRHLKNTKEMVFEDFIKINLDN